MNRTHPSRRPSRALRVLRLAAAAAFACSAVVVVAPVAAAPAGACGPGGTIEDAGNGWLASHPAFPAGPAEVTLVASPAYDPNLIYATNGISLMRSRDAGCGWQPVFQAQSLVDVPVASVQITALTAPTSANNSSFVYVGVTSTVAGVDTPLILASSDRGDTWVQAMEQEGLSPAGRVLEIAASPQVQQVAFAIIDVTVRDVRSSTALYMTTDGGETWAPRNDTVGSFAYRQLAPHPVVQNTLYALDNGRPVVSADNGGTFTPTGGDPGRLDVLTAASGVGGIRLAGAAADGGVFRSDDGGRRWTSMRSPIPARSVGIGPLQDVVVASDSVDLLLLVDKRPPVPATPKEGGAPLQLSVSAPTMIGFGITGVSAGAVFRASFSVNGTVLPPPRGPGGRLKPILLLPSTPGAQFPSMLLPATVSVRLPAGGSMRLPFRLLVPRTPMPVDVMFLIDSTGSYSEVIEGLRLAMARIANSLNTAGLDARFGIADFRDYPPPYGAGSAGDWPYRLRRRIGPSGEAFEAAIQSIKTGGGTTDGGQSSLTAIYQAVTGEGEVVRGDRVIKKGLEARFRPHALKLAITSTDTTPHERGQKVEVSDGSGDTVVHPGPTFEQLTKALRAHGIRSVGLPVADEYVEGTAVPALTRLARATGATAPPGGVDCDGNGTVDLVTGGPLVCRLPFSTTGMENRTGLAAAIVGLVAGISDPQPVSLRVTRGAERARIVTPPSRVVDLHADNELDHLVEVTCPRTKAARYEIGLQSATPLAPLAAGGISLSCGGVPGAPPAPPGAEPEPVEPEPVDPQRAAPANVASDLNVNVNTNSNTNPNVNTNVNPQPLPNANTGAAYQEEQQMQLALVEDSLRSDPGVEYAMSGRAGAYTEPGIGFAAAAAVMLAGASGVAVRTRRRTAYGVVRAYDTRAAPRR